MKKLILNIEESKYRAFLSYIETLDYVSVSKNEDLPVWQQEEVKRRMDLVAKGEMKARTWDEARKDVFKK
ncbi:MAG TPA: addiction module protein [Cryomorphaceae bacterium]|nr:addiction module protein [Cryomorphaceae bacterium]